MHKKLVIFDTNHGLNNRFFRREVIGKNRFLWPWCFLYEKCRERGIELVSGDIYLKIKNKPQSALLFSRDMITKDTYEFIKMGLRPIVLYAIENPLYACRFYFNFKKYLNDFDNVFTFGSLRNLIPPKKFTQAFYPVPYSQNDLCSSLFKNRKYLTMIVRNHRIHPLKRLYVNIFQRFKPLPTLVNRDLYLDRMEAVRYFSKYNDFDLWGYGWDNPAYRGIAEDKFETLKNYKFSICFENCIMGGWITEKIFDSMMAGAVPVYWGAPNVTDYIPKNCFIDFRDFNSFEELDKYLRSIDEFTYGRYIQNIKGFFSGELYKRFFSQEVFAEKFVNLFESYF